MALGIALQLAVPHAAYGCIMRHEFPQENVEASHVIFRGKVVAYKLIHRGVARLTFETTNTYKGLHKSSWYVRWYIYRAVVPKNLQEFTAAFGEDVVTGVRLLPLPRILPMLRHGYWNFALYAVGGRFEQIRSMPHLFWPMPRVVSVVCSPSFIERFEVLEPRLRELDVIN